MHTKIRIGGFETNSSSMHGFRLGFRGAPLLKIEPDEDAGSIEIGLDYYGWGWELLTEPKQKASYVFSWLFANARSQRAKEIQGLIEKHCGHKVVVRPNPNNWRYTTSSFADYGVDHQSNEHLEPIIDDDDLIIDLIFNPTAVIIIGNDNSEPPPSVLCGRNEARFVATIKIDNDPHGRAETVYMRYNNADAVEVLMDDYIYRLADRILSIMGVDSIYSTYDLYMRNHHLHRIDEYTYEFTVSTELCKTNRRETYKAIITLEPYDNPYISNAQAKQHAHA